MKNEYKRTFDAVKMSKESEEKIYLAVSAHLSSVNKGRHIKAGKKRIFQKPLPVAAVLAVLSFVLVGFAFGNQLIALLGGGHFEQGRNENGEDVVSMEMGFRTNPVRIENGQIYFILDGLEENITGQCSAETYFAYEKTDASGYRHVVVIGGTAEKMGMAEFIWDEKGKFAGNNASYNGEEEPPWLKSAKTKLLP